MIILNQTIISVAFHPGGEYIAVACGMRIDLWEWRVPLTYHEEIPQLPTHTPFAPNSKHLRHSSDESEDEDSPLTRSITHKRNIRAVIFHPSGDYIFAVAPDAPKQNNEELSHCKYVPTSVLCLCISIWLCSFAGRNRLLPTWFCTFMTVRPQNPRLVDVFIAYFSGF
jgi:hypothetical protein